MLCQHGAVADAQAGPESGAAPELDQTSDTPAPRRRGLWDDAVTRIDAVTSEWWALLAMMTLWTVVFTRLVWLRQNRFGSSSERSTVTHAARSSRPLLAIHERSRNVFPLPAGAETARTS